MAIAFILIGVILVIVAIRNSYAQLGQQLKQDFTGGDNFGYWIASLVIIGAVGYIPYLKTPSRMLLALVITVFLLKNGTGFFSQLNSALKSPPQPSKTSTEQIPTSVPVTISGGSGGSGGSGAAGTALGIIGKIAGGLFGL
jgi:hypothetical protein